MKEIQFYQCSSCKTTLLALCGKEPQCCNQELSLLLPNSIEASTEKHVPVLEFGDGVLKVKVGSAAHPMLPEHHISWIFVETAKGGQYARLTTEDLPEASFSVIKSEVLAVYAFCNLHGLWRANLG